MASPSHQGSVPTSPYGHPLGIAVAHGGGLGRSGTILPAIVSWDEAEEGDEDINPMFRVVSVNLSQWDRA